MRELIAKILISFRCSFQIQVISVSWLGKTFSSKKAKPVRVFSARSLTKDHVLHADAVVVGTGAGGAITAFTFVEAGLKTILIEEGGYYTGKDLDGDPLRSILLLYRDQGLTFTFGTSIPVPLGRCVGGTTMINSATSFRTPDFVLKIWEEEYGLCGATELQPFYEEIEFLLHIQPVSDDRYGPGNRIVEDAAKKLGWKGRRITRNEDGCLASGVCPFGCPSDGKLSMAVSIIPQVIEKGGELWIHARARRILHHQGQAVGVVCEVVPEGKNPSHPITLTILAPWVVLSAGAFFTPALLLQSGISAPGLGRNLHLHPAVRVIARLPERIEGWKEVPQSYHIDEFIPQGVFLQGQFVPPEIQGSALPGFGVTHKERMQSYPYLSSFGALISDQSSGRILTLGGHHRPLVFYSLSREDTRKLTFAIARTVELYLTAGAIEVYTGIARFPIVRNFQELRELERGRFRPSEFELMAFHPMGTASAGNRPFNPCDPWGRVKGYRGLYVADASLFPSSNRINPQLTIMALVRRNAREWVKRGE